jgi:hypothetical protein
MIEVSIRKFYVIEEDGADMVPRVGINRLPTPEETAQAEKVFDDMARELGAREMTDDERKDYIAAEQAAEDEADDGVTSFTLRRPA